MRSKAPLALMEQAVMVLVFALAAVLCLRVFVWSDSASKRGSAKDRAVIEAQTAAELIKNEGKSGCGEEAALRAVCERLGGTYDGAEGQLRLGYDADWQITDEEENMSYILIASADESGNDMLGAVRIGVIEQSKGETLFEITAAWQKGAD